LRTNRHAYIAYDDSTLNKNKKNNIKYIHMIVLFFQIVTNLFKIRYIYSPSGKILTLFKNRSVSITNLTVNAQVSKIKRYIIVKLTIKL